MFGWDLRGLVLEGTSYPLRESYESFLEIVGVEYLYQVKGLTLKIKNIGDVVVNRIDYVQKEKVVDLICSLKI